MKVKDHWGLAHREYNLNITPAKKLPVVFHKLQKYDSHLLFQELGKNNLKTNFIAKKPEICMIYKTEQNKEVTIDRGLPLVFINSAPFPNVSN